MSKNIFVVGTGITVETDMALLEQMGYTVIKEPS
jgi:hypothetical protein